jgi:peptidoglycan/LPS O-acetylase OafA/YrhL
MRWIASSLFLYGSIALVGIVLILSRMGKLGNLFDPILGISFVPLVAACAIRGGGDGFYGKISVAASEISYTLYLVHFPLMAGLFFILMPGKQTALGVSGMEFFILVLSVVILYAAATWWLFERNTDRVRKFMGNRLILNK